MACPPVHAPMALATLSAARFIAPISVGASGAAWVSRTWMVGIATIIVAPTANRPAIRTPAFWPPIASSAMATSALPKPAATPRVG
ncbi:hypothetical protein D3C71_1927000 [compost metagenome]